MNLFFFWCFIQKKNDSRPLRQHFSTICCKLLCTANKTTFFHLPGSVDSSPPYWQLGHNKQPYDKLLLAADTRQIMMGLSLRIIIRRECLFDLNALGLVLRVLSCKAPFLLLQPAVCLPISGLSCSASAVCYKSSINSSDPNPYIHH